MNNQVFVGTILNPGLIQCPRCTRLMSYKDRAVCSNCGHINTYADSLLEFKLLKELGLVKGDFWRNWATIRKAAKILLLKRLIS